MLDFCMSFFTAGSWCKFKKRHAKTKHHNKRLALLILTGLYNYIAKRIFLQEERSKEKWKVPLPFDRLFLDRVRTRSLVKKLGVSFDLLPTEQLAVVETSQQLHAKRTYGHRGRRQGRQRDSKASRALLYYIVDVLWGQPIKLIQVASTSELH